MQHLLLNALGRPHFIAYDCYHDHTPSLWLARKLFRPITVAWTVKTQADLDKALTRYDTAIFEGFIPNSR